MIGLQIRQLRKSRSMTLQKSLVWFEDAAAEPVPDLIRNIEWQLVRREIEDAVKAMWA